LSTWIGSITYNVTIDHLRKKGREVINYEMDINAGVNLFSDNPGPLADIGKSEIIKIVHEIIEKLPLQYRTVITLFYLEEFSHDEIREITSMPVGTIKSYLSRGRKLISDMVASKIPELKMDYFEKL
jgi:RNA polymerase sigma-70 factor (ECF subfamily)